MTRSRLVVLAAIALTGGCGQPNEFAPPPPPEVTVAHPEQRDVTTFDEFTGRTDAVNEAQIRARVTGFLETMEYGPGDVVEAGAPLFTIERRPFEAARDSAKAELEQRKADHALAVTNLKLLRDASEKGAASAIEMEQAVAERDVAAARVTAAEAALEDAEITLSYTKISAPITGRTSRNYEDPGNLVGSGDATLLATIVQEDPIYAYVTVDERSILRYLAEGRPSQQPEEKRREVWLQFADGRQYEHMGRTDMADNRIDPETGTVEIRCVFPNPDGVVVPGAFVRVRVPQTAEQAVLVPEVALQRDLAGDYVLVVEENGVVGRRDVVRGRAAEGMRIIESGLSPEDRVLVNGIQRARVGITVNATEAEASAPAPPAAAAPADPDAPAEDGT